MLSRHERHQLYGIEQWLEDSDPAFAKTLRDGDVERPRQSLNRRSSRLTLDAFGSFVLVLGIIAAHEGLFFIGVVLLSAAVAMHVNARQAVNGDDE